MGLRWGCAVGGQGGCSGGPARLGLLSRAGSGGGCGGAGGGGEGGARGDDRVAKRAGAGDGHARLRDVSGDAARCDGGIAGRASAAFARGGCGGGGATIAAT